VKKVSNRTSFIEEVNDAACLEG